MVDKSFLDRYILFCFDIFVCDVKNVYDDFKVCCKIYIEIFW